MVRGREGCRRISLAAVLLASGLCLFPQAYTIFAEDAAGLWGQPDGTGCGNDIVKAAFEASGVDVRLEIVPYNRAKVLVMEGRAFACFGMSWSKELRGKIDFPAEPIYSTVTTVFVRKADASRIRKAADIPAGTVAGIVLGYEYPEEFVRLVDSGVVKLDAAPSEALCLKKLALGRIDVAIANLDSLKSAEYLMNEAGVADRIQEAFALGVSGTYLGFNAKNPDTPAAMRAFEAGMAELRASGKLESLIAAWRARR
jgi:polar amino acid transport system substrate-binding protein